MSYRIIVDVMGSDSGLARRSSAARSTARRFPEARFFSWVTAKS